MPSPLYRRFPREFKNNKGKYLGLFLLMAVSISLVSGFLVAASSIERIIDEMRDAYSVEDGRFIADFEASDEAIAAVEGQGVVVHENFSYDLPLVADGADDATVRVHTNRTGFDEAAYAEGTEPEGSDEIAIDRVFAEHHGLGIGDVIEVAGKHFVISGIMTLPDYAGLFERNTDFVFNALTFCTAVVDEPAFEEFAGESKSFTYSFLFTDRALSLADRISAEGDVAETLADKGVSLSDMIDAESNQGITYPSQDVQGDQMMWEVLLFLIIIIVAFVSVVLTSSTIDEESAVIGTLLASGYRKRELIAHYLAMPCFVGLLAAIVGNVLGYAVFADPMKDLYYNSYSLPPYESFWNMRVFLITTVVPFALLMVITLVGLIRKLRCTPLQFLRRETGKRGSRRGLRLPDRLGFVVRFRLRIFLRNISHFVTLFFGITFASLLLLFGLCMMPTVDHYAESLRNNLVAEHQYTLKAPLEIDATAEEREAFAAAQTLATTEDLDTIDPLELAILMQKAQEIDAEAHPINTEENDAASIEQAEKFAVYELQTPRLWGGESETITFYGIQDDSRYWNDIDVGQNRVVVGQGVLDKCGVTVGEPRVFTDKFTDDTYELVPSAVYDSSTSMAVYLDIDDFNALFDNDADYFNGYVSDDALNLDGRYLAADLTPAEMNKISDQMQDSMGDVIGIIVPVSVLIYLILMYLLTKTVIDRNARAISYMKVFGYRNAEISKLYIRSITITVMVSLIACLPLIIGSISLLMKVVFMQYGGNMEVFVPGDRLAIELLIGIASYAVIASLHVRRIRGVPLSVALKAQE